MTSISHVVLVSWKSGKHIQAEELIRPSVRGFVGTIPGVLAVVEGHSTSPAGRARPRPGLNAPYPHTRGQPPGGRGCEVQPRYARNGRER